MRNNKISKIPVALTDTWHTRLSDLPYMKSWNIPDYLIFSGNPIEHNSLSKEQEHSTIRPIRPFNPELF